MESHADSRIEGNTAQYWARLLRRSIVAFLLAGLLATGAASTMAAQSSSVSRELASQLVEIPEAGIAVTFPVGWRIWSALPSEGEAFVQASNVPMRQVCRIFPTEKFATPETAADDVFGRPQPGIEILERVALSVPVGEAIRLSWRYMGAPSGFYDYYVAVPRGVVTVSCSGSEAPPDRWLDIVESIEALPVDAPATGSFDPRVEVPDHGFAIDFPVEWLVTAWPWSGTPGPVGGDAVLRAQSAAECWIFDDMGLPRLSDVESIEDWLEQLIEEIRARRLRAGPMVTEVALPSGTSARVDWEWKKNGELPTSAWALSDGEKSVLLLCRSEQPPEDRWQSIAETFELLPAEED